MPGKKPWELYPRLTAAIKKTHDENGGIFYCHDFAHVIRVANYCDVIAPNERAGRLAGVAALCHNADRILQKQLGVGGLGKVPDASVEAMVNGWLDTEKETFSDQEVMIIVDAVLKHSSKNGADDTTVVITLMEADRIVNAELDVVMRQGQYYPDLPYADPVNFLDVPGETFKTPKTVLSSLILARKEWLDDNGPVRMRLSKARAMLVARYWDLTHYADMVFSQYKSAGLDPFPFVS
jgi:hypothetical protein